AVLAESGYEVYAPQLPNSHKPDRVTYEKFLRESGWNFEDNVLVGHSSGATTILNLLTSDWFPGAEAAVLVGTFLNEDLTNVAEWVEPGQFAGLFPNEGFDISKLGSKCKSFYLVHGSDDPYCSYDDAKDFAMKLGGRFITVAGGHHLGVRSGIHELPSLYEALEEDGFLSNEDH
ncbi:MAG: alpha/beta hydrolase, partial [Candidatus Saccharimonadaceae bacterium]